jgi:hypothetical protein
VTTLRQDVSLLALTEVGGDFDVLFSGGTFKSLSVPLLATIKGDFRGTDIAGSPFTNTLCKAVVGRYTFNPV